MNRVEVMLKNGKWLINGRLYQDLQKKEKEFFDNFLVAMRIEKGIENAKSDQHEKA